MREIVRRTIILKQIRLCAGNPHGIICVHHHTYRPPFMGGFIFFRHKTINPGFIAVISYQSVLSANPDIALSVLLYEVDVCRR